MDVNTDINIALMACVIMSFIYNVIDRTSKTEKQLAVVEKRLIDIDTFVKAIWDYIMEDDDDSDDETEEELPEPKDDKIQNRHLAVFRQSTYNNKTWL